MGVWQRSPSGSYRLSGSGRTALIAGRDFPANGAFKIALRPPTLGDNVFVALPSSKDGRSGYLVGLQGVNIVIATVEFADPATFTVKDSAAHGLDTSAPFGLEVRMVNGVIEARLNGATDPAVSFTADQFLGYKHFGFVSNIDGAQVTSAMLCTLAPVVQNREDVLVAVAGGDVFLVQQQTEDLFTKRLIRAAAFNPFGDVSLLAFQQKVHGVDGAHWVRIDPKALTAEKFLPAYGSLPGATEDPDHPGTFLPGTTSATMLEAYRGRVWADYGPIDPQNLVACAVNDDTDWDTGADRFGKAFALGVSQLSKIGQPITCLVRSTLNTLVIGCTGSIWALSGDPTTGIPELSEILSKTGISGKDAVSSLAEGRMVVHSPDGAYVIGGVSEYGVSSPPTNLSAPVLTDVINIGRQNTGNFIVQVRRDPVRNIVHFFLTPRSSSDALHLAYDERVGEYQPQAGGWFPDDFLSRWGPTASTPEPFLGNIIWGTRDGLLCRLDNAINRDGGFDVVPVRVPFTPLLEALINRDTILHKFSVALGEGSVVKFRVWGGQSAEKVYAAAAGSYLLQSGTCPPDGRWNVRKSRAPAVMIELYSDEPAPFEIEDADAVSMVGRQVTRRNLAPGAAPGAPCTPAFLPSSSVPTSEVSYDTGPGNGTLSTGETLTEPSLTNPGITVATGSEGTLITHPTEPITILTGTSGTLVTNTEATEPITIITATGGTPVTESDPATDVTVSEAPASSASSTPIGFTVPSSAPSIGSLTELGSGTSNPLTLPPLSIESGDTVGGTLEEGWTVFKPSGDSLLIYVSQSMGSDLNDGRSEATPKKTIAAGKSLLRDTYPDYLLLKRDDAWDEPLGGWSLSGRSAAEPMVVMAYGTGARPHLRCGTGDGFTFINNHSPLPTPDPKGWLAIVDLHFESQQDGATTAPSGLSFNGRITALLLENLYVEKFSTGINVDGDNTLCPASSFRVNRCAAVDSFRLINNGFAHGMYFGAVNGLILDEVLTDHNGWQQGVTQLNNPVTNHNIYIQDHPSERGCTNVVLNGVLHARSCGSSLQQRPGGSAYRITGIDNPFHFVFGANLQDGDATGILCYGAHNSPDFMGDGGAPLGLGIQAGASGGVNSTRIADFLCVGAGAITSTDSIVAVSTGETTTNVLVEDGIVLNWVSVTGGAQPGDCVRYGGTPAAVTVRNCDLQQASGGGNLINALAVPSGPESYSGNRYCATGNALPFQRNGVSETFTTWHTATGDTSSAPTTAVSYPDATRTMSSYLTSIGVTPGADPNDTFLQRRRLWDKGALDLRFGDLDFNNYMRAGVGKSALV